MIETSDEVIVEQAYGSSATSHSNGHKSYLQISNTASKRPASAKENYSGSSSSTLGANDASRYKVQNEKRPGVNQSRGATIDNFTDFFSKEVFRIVLQNPTTSHSFMRFCQSRACSENIEFLQKVDAYNRLLDDVTRLLAEIQTTFISIEGRRQINVSHASAKRMTTDIKVTTQSTIPAMEAIFAAAQDHVEKLLATDMYPRFVKHQITTSATLALIDDKSRFQGLGDCFCLTDPSIADNPIVYASDGFVEVTGYSRKEIVPRNCRFLQGAMTDKVSVKRLRYSIDNAEEIVELLLNYRKNGDPFWNLLYVAPLLDQNGNVAFFIGGQINCSTTIHSCTDILKILSLNDEGLSERQVESRAVHSDSPPSGRSVTNPPLTSRSRSTFFKSFRKQKANVPEVHVRAETGMEGELIQKIGKLNFRTQVETFYTAYSKYFVLAYSQTSTNLVIKYFSPGIIDMLSLNLRDGEKAPIFDRDIFKVLLEYSLPSSVQKDLKATVRDSIKRGAAVSVELGLMTGMETKKSGFSIMGDRKIARTEGNYVSHWTPLKDEEGMPCWVILMIAPK